MLDVMYIIRKIGAIVKVWVCATGRIVLVLLLSETAN